MTNLLRFFISRQPTKCKSSGGDNEDGDNDDDDFDDHLRGRRKKRRIEDLYEIGGLCCVLFTLPEYSGITLLRTF